MSRCHFNGCPNEVRPGSIKCIYHRKKGICSGPNCRNQVYARGKCVLHGARNPCKHPGCHGYARSRGKCSRHATNNGDKTDCSSSPSFYLEKLANVADQQRRVELPRLREEYMPEEYRAHAPPTISSAWMSETTYCSVKDEYESSYGGYFCKSDQSTVRSPASAMDVRELPPLQPVHSSCGVTLPPLTDYLKTIIKS
ncbi:Aste57867_15088 [Aphanomyces stellatus]|uniref:Aste57867_15088 protein n=1 Tax=Aphanomyces stellatus TaxID=120398 RepID=A0A485L368_9STRA|nr:hypothetical protein As57867_015032 [Aphanomyces stellatus]VFT91901.1 Aste57867_15088 [Aphanomyces stellatus]